jgi:hypothetical protein
VVDTPVLIFDGDCGFRTTSVNFAQRRVPIRAVVARWQRTDLASLGIDRSVQTLSTPAFRARSDESYY